MKTNPTAPNYKGFRFPSEIISHALWLYFRFSLTLSFRDGEELLAQRGIIVIYETVGCTNHLPLPLCWLPGRSVIEK
jgi:putative transposase